MNKLLQIYFLSSFLFGLLNFASTTQSIKEINDSLLTTSQDLTEREKVEYLNTLSWNLREKNPKLALHYGEQAMQMADSLNLTHLYGRASNSIGVILVHYMYKTREAIPYFHRSLEIALIENDSLSIGYSYNNLGDIYYLTGNAPLALEYAERSMKYMKEVGDPSGIAYTHINFGLVYRFEKQYQKAIEHFNKAIEIRKSIGFNLGVASALYELGIVYFEMEQFDKALEYYQESYELNKKINNKRWTAFSLDGLGKVYYKLGQYQKALEMLNQSLQLNIEKSHKYGEISNRIGKALVYSKTNQKNLGEAELEKALELSNELGVATKLLETYEAVANFYLNVNDFRAATRSFNSFLQVYDSLYFAQQFETFTELQNNFAIKLRLEESKKVLESKQREEYYLIIILVLMVFLIFILAWKYRSNRKLNKQLKSLIDTKDKLFSIISHDLRNPFSVVMGYTEILREEDLSDNERIEVINNLDQVTQNTYGLLENLLNLSASKRGDLEFEPKQVSIQSVADEVYYSVKGQLNGKSITLEKELEEKEIFADKNMLEIIIRNLVTNAIKYSNENGTITIKSEKDGNNFKLHIIDDGIGMSEEVSKALFKGDFAKPRKGTAGEKGTGLGLSLCKEFVEQHGGSIKVNSQPNKGSEFIIILPSN